MFKRGSKKKANQKKKTASKTSLKIKELQLKFKRWQEQEKERKELKRQELNQSVKPKGYVARKTGVVIFWALFGFMFLVVTITLFSGDDNASADQNFDVVQNEATTPEAIQFAENFLKDYFTWTASEEGQEKRIGIMAKYLAESLRGHKALDIQNLEWNSTFKKAELKDITEKGENLAHITFLVDFEFQQKSDKENKDKEQESKHLQKYIQVPVAYDGYSFGVYELPKFTYINEDETTVKEVKTERLEQSNVSVADKIKEFLPTFFKAYAEDEQEKLNYMLKEDNSVQSLDGSMIFEDIENLQVFNGKAENQYLVFAEIRFREPETNVVFFVTHQLELIQEDQRFLLLGMDNFDEKGVISSINEESKGVIVEAEEPDITEATPESSENEQTENE